MRLGSLLFLSLLVSCHLDVNTSDAQTSPNINQSKQDGFFKKEYKVASLNCECNVGEAWIENSWFNEVHGFKVRKVKIDRLQLNFAVNNLRLNLNRYLYDWEFSDSSHQLLGTYANGHYVLFLEKNEVPDSFRINLYQLKEKKVIGSILLSAK